VKHAVGDHRAGILHLKVGFSTFPNALFLNSVSIERDVHFYMGFGSVGSRERAF
jgi:hypothetical protein